MREMGGMGSSMCFFLDFLSWKKCAVNVLIFFPLPDLRPLHCGFLREHHPLGGGRQHWGLITLGSHPVSLQKNPYHLKFA